MRSMPRFRPTSPLGLAFGAFHLWRRLPPAQRKQVLQTARTHGPKVAAALLAKRKRAASARYAVPSASRTIRSCSSRCAVG